MQRPRCLVIRSAGTNCDEETHYAWALAGARPQRIHINRLIEQPALLREYQILTIPGGFSYGDDVAAGKILANQLTAYFSDAMREFISSDKLILGICNGFQVLVKAGLLPGGKVGRDCVTLCLNDSARFEDRWVYLNPGSARCVFLTDVGRIHLPIAHAEGKLAAKDDATLSTLAGAGHVALRYVDSDGSAGAYPINPNGSVLDAAGLTDETGRVLGMMPHPERFVHATHHPYWTRSRSPDRSDGVKLFENAVRYFA